MMMMIMRMMMRRRMARMRNENLKVARQEQTLQLVLRLDLVRKHQAEVPQERRVAASEGLSDGPEVGYCAWLVPPVLELLQLGEQAIEESIAALLGRERQ